MPELVVFGRRRARYGGKKKYGWRLVATNGRVICGDSRQDYNHGSDALAIAERVLKGDFAQHTIRREG